MEDPSYKLYKNIFELINKYKINSYINIEKRMRYNEFDILRKKGYKIFQINCNFNLILIYFIIIVLILGGSFTGKTCLINR